MQTQQKKSNQIKTLSKEMLEDGEKSPTAKLLNFKRRPDK